VQALPSIPELCFMEPYIIPAATRIGHVHLKVADLQWALDFYCGLLGFELVTTYGTDAAFISAGGYHHHIGLNTWYSKGAPPAPVRSAGLFHTAILYPQRRDLAIAVQRLLSASYPLTGTIRTKTVWSFIGTNPATNGRIQPTAPSPCTPGSWI
jgi:catechol 2,3-dioxygenase